MKKASWAHVGLICVNFIYGGNYIVAKDLMPHVIGPSGFITLRILGATILFGILFLFNREPIQKKDWGRIVLCALFGITINQLLFFNGLSLTSPINSSIIMTSTPILVLVASSFLLKEKITKMRIAGVVIGFLGAVGLIVTGKNTSNISSGIGDLMIFLNAMSYGIYLVLAKPLMQKYKPTTLIFIFFLLGFFFTLPFGYTQFSEVEWSALTSYHMGAISYVVLGTTFLAYLLNIYSLKFVSPSVTSSYIYMQPMVALLAAYFFFHWGITQQNMNDLTFVKCIFMLLIFAGVYLVNKNKSKAA